MNPTDLYFSLPVALQNLACNVTSYKNRIVRYPKRFHELLAEYNARSEWSHDRLIAYQGERIARLVLHCYETVPHYRKVMDEGGIDPSSVRSIEDLKRFPVLTKEEVNRRPEDFLSSAYAGKPCIKRHTSGTTGSAFRFVMNREAFIEQWAVCWRYWCKLGLSFDQPHAMFGTRRDSRARPGLPSVLEAEGGNEGAVLQRLPRIPGQHEGVLRRNRPERVHLDPRLSVLGRPAGFLHGGKRPAFFVQGEERDLGRRKPPGASEKADKRGLRRRSQTTLRGKRRHGERLRERGRQDVCGRRLLCDGIRAVRGRRPRDRRHFADELRDAADSLEAEGLRVGRPATKNGFRYVSSLDGRTEDYVVLPNGVRVGRLARVFKDTVHFREVQIHQNADYSIVINAVRSSDDVSEDERTALDELRQSIGRSIPVRFNYVDRIEKTRGGGKFKFVVSEVSQDAADGF